MSTINTNIPSLVAQQAMVVSGRERANAMESLSTGKRVNSASDDSAGLTISNRLNTRVISLAQSVRNANDGISILQTADGASKGMTDMLFRMRELAVQYRTGTNTSDDKDALDIEYNELRAQIQQITTNTQWNGDKIIGGDRVTVSFQVGAGSGDQISVTLKNMWTSGVASYVVSGLAASTIGDLDTAIKKVDEFRSSMGATINRLIYASNNSSNVMINSAASSSRIVDTDYAKATADLARAQIIQQAGSAMLTQANQSQRLVFMLLK
jgi:flagellin